ncbi:MAG: hypothetical protein WCK47_09115 [bacterium]|nr:hypothetical protein [Candidatus Sumerlaeota bacterium]
MINFINADTIPGVIEHKPEHLAGRAPAARIGLLSLISADCDTVASMAQKARQFQVDAFETLAALGFHVMRVSEITRTPEEAARHIRMLESAGAEALVMYVVDWSYSTTAAIGSLLNNGLPVVLWTNARPDCVGLVGMAITKGGLDEVGIDAAVVYGNFDDPATQDELKTLCTASAAARRLRGMRYGLGGTRSLEMLTSVVDPNQWLMKFGVDVSGFDELDVADRAQHIGAKEVDLYKKWLTSEFGAVEVDEIVVEMSVRLYLALKQVIAENSFDFVSVKCLPVMPRIMTSFCLAHALLGDSSDAQGSKERTVCACESDSNGALTMQMMKNVSDQAINFADVRWLDPQTGMLRISNCGSQATELARSRKDVCWVKHGLQEIPWKHGGMCPQCVSRPGRVTLARLSRVKGRYVMLVAGGESLNIPREALKTTYWEFSPHTFVRVDAPALAFVKQLRSNHIHMMYGDWQRELVGLCQVLDIETVMPGV